MQSSEELVSKLPMLRRFSRLLMGNQKAGDVLAIAALQSFSSGLALSTEGFDLKARLYRSLVRVWNSPSGSFLAEKSAAIIRSSPSEVGMGKYLSMSRAAFLLTRLEEFSNETTRWILELDENAFAECLARASEEVNYLLATSVMIIEDEMLIASQLESIMQLLGHEVTSVVSTAKQAIAASKKNAPKLILSDIQLADGSSGIEAVAQIVKNLPTPTIFITAFPERLLTGLRPEPTFLLTKPFRSDQVKAVVSQAIFFDTRIRLRVSSEELSEAMVQEWSRA